MLSKGQAGRQAEMYVDRVVKVRNFEKKVARLSSVQSGKAVANTRPGPCQLLLLLPLLLLCGLICPSSPGLSLLGWARARGMTSENRRGGVWVD